MAERDRSIIPLVKNVTEVIDAEDLALEAARDLIKDEIKRVIRLRLEEDPALRDEIKEAISLYLESKARQAFAMVKLTKVEFLWRRLQGACHRASSLRYRCTVVS